MDWYESEPGSAWRRAPSTITGPLRIRGGAPALIAPREHPWLEPAGSQGLVRLLLLTTTCGVLYNLSYTFAWAVVWSESIGWLGLFFSSFYWLFAGSYLFLTVIGLVAFVLTSRAGELPLYQAVLWGGTAAASTHFLPGDLVPLSGLLAAPATAAGMWIGGFLTVR